MTSRAACLRCSQKFTYLQIPMPMRRFAPFLLSLLFISCASVPQGNAVQDSPRNVVFFISDGCGPASFSLARDFQRDTEGVPNLQLDGFERGSTITFSETGRVTDSAASATAYACAVKTLNGRIGMTADKQSIATILEKAEAAGYNTGLVSTARITHATPAAFSSHVESRNMESEIAEQQIEQGIEILMGGGRQFYVPREAGGLRTDGRDLIAELQGKGYARADNRTELASVQDLPLVALFTSSHMAYELDRDPSREPSLAEMTSRALDLLAAEDEPFFIMIEAGRIDHAGHGNDPAAHLWDVLAYDAAWKAAVDFARVNGETLVVGTSDHETGGLTLGAETDGVSNTGYAYDPTRLAPVTSSIEKFRTRFADETGDGPVDRAALEQQLRSLFNIDTDAAAPAIDAFMLRAESDRIGAMNSLQQLVSNVISDSARVGWATGGHTAVNVPIYTYGPGSERFFGTLDNTDVGRKLQEVLGFQP